MQLLCIVAGHTMVLHAVHFIGHFWCVTIVAELTKLTRMNNCGMPTIMHAVISCVSIF
jgi:hypothetical protein